jgi:hypothetical protein
LAFDFFAVCLLSILSLLRRWFIPALAPRRLALAVWVSWPLKNTVAAEAEYRTAALCTGSAGAVPLTLSGLWLVGMSNISRHLCAHGECVAPDALAIRSLQPNTTYSQLSESTAYGKFDTCKLKLPCRGKAHATGPPGNQRDPSVESAHDVALRMCLSRRVRVAREHGPILIKPAARRGIYWTLVSIGTL